MANQVHIRIKTQDSEEGTSCLVIGSVRWEHISLRIDGGPENWAHMTADEACRLYDFLDRAIAEVWERMGPEKFDKLVEKE